MPQWSLLPHPSTKSHQRSSAKGGEEVSMMMEVRELLSRAVLDMSGQMSGNSTPKRLNHMVMLIPLPPKLADLSGPVDTSSQVSTPDEAEMGEASLEQIPIAPSPIPKTLGLSSGTSTENTIFLWKEANKALGELLTTRPSIDAYQWKLVWKLGMDLHQNESDRTKSIREAKAICNAAIQEAKAACACSIQEAEMCCSMASKEAKVTCAHTMKEAKILCSMAMRDAEAWGAIQDGTLQKSHAEFMLCLEEQAIEEENKSQLDFLSTCQATLPASPAELHNTLVAPYQVLMGQVPMSLPYDPSQWASSSEQVPALWLLPHLHLSLCPGPSGDIPLQTWWMPCLPVGPHPRQTWHVSIVSNDEKWCPCIRH